MRPSEVRKFPTCVPTGGAWAAGGVHERCLRAYQILLLVKRWLAKGGVPGEVILELIDDMEGKEDQA